MARYIGSKPKLQENSVRQSMVMIKTLKKKVPTRTTRPNKRRGAKKSEYAVQLAENKKQNILTVSLKDNSLIFMKKRKDLKG